MQAETEKRPIIWSMAGSDCSGGAGIQADIRTGHALGCETCTLITANTVQNSNSLSAIHPVEVDILQQQFDCLLADKPPAAIKIGLIANNQQLQWLIDALKHLKAIHAELKVVLDPVMKASVGEDLVAEPIQQPLLQQLISQVDVITPNLEETALLANDPQQQLSPAEQALAILNTGCHSVIITGGHGEPSEQLVDHCFSNKLHLSLKSEWVSTSYTHGSGCTFSTAITSFLAQDYLLRDAFMQSKAFMNKAFALSANHQHYYGALIQPSWPVAKQFYPQVISSVNATLKTPLQFASLGVQNLGLYPVVDSVEWLQALLPTGLEIIQLRLKNRSEAELDQQIKQAVELSKGHPTRLFINDHWKLAIKHQAYGVHLGQEDLNCADLQAIHQAGLRLGISTHGSYELLLAEQIKPSYMAIGAIFNTQTKDMSGQIQGLKNLQQLVKINGEVPIVAIGGITLDNAQSVIETGVNSIAVVTAITLAKEPTKAVRAFQSLFSKAINTRA